MSPGKREHDAYSKGGLHFRPHVMILRLLADEPFWRFRDLNKIKDVLTEGEYET